MQWEHCLQKYNDTPKKASRAYDANRDGFVISGGGGALVLESLEHAEAPWCSYNCGARWLWRNF